MELTAAACLIVGLVAILLAERARRRANVLETTVQDLFLENSKILHENIQLRNRMDIQKMRLKNVETEVSSWRLSLESCAREHFNLSDKIHDLDDGITIVVDEG